jgi:hypothetical protein
MRIAFKKPDDKSPEEWETMLNYLEREYANARSLSDLPSMTLYDLLDIDDRYAVHEAAFAHTSEEMQERCSDEANMWQLAQYCRKHRTELIEKLIACGRIEKPSKAKGGGA